MKARRSRPLRLAFPPWCIRVALTALAAFAAGGSCSPRALIEVDVFGDTPFQGVSLRLSAGATSKDFARASFTADMPFKAGLYVDGSGASAVVTARALDGSGGCIGIGYGSAMDLSPGGTTAPVKITVVHSATCTGGPPAGGLGGGSGGGASGDGTGGNNSGAGGSSSGAGGSGSGLGGSNGGLGGANGGSGGQPGGNNLVTNGDFSNGENSWGFPAMMGTVSHTVTNGALCVTIGSSNASVTIGYPSGGTAPFQINGGTAYRFSYQASVSASNTTFEAKVGQTNMPYDATGSDWPGESVGTSLQTFTHTFTRGSTDSSMGVAFNLMGGPSTVCIDNVSLTAN
jgi:hypothetical protein